MEHKLSAILSPGDVIKGKYKVLRQIGRGGMGEVYQVYHLTLETTLALKVLHEDLAANADLVRRFHQEARVMAQLKHSNIVRVLDMDQDGDTLFFVMEYIAGQNLRQRLQERGHLPVPEVLAIAEQIARALEFAHQHQPPIIHRDIKPSNIVQEEGTGRAMLMDLGIAKVLGTTEQTRTGVVLSTPRYCAPEQLRQAKELDGRADIYSLGLVMYELVEGRPFFEERDEQALLRRALYGPEENVPTFAWPVPSVFVDLVTRAIAREPERRYPRAADLLRDIEACLAPPPATGSTERLGDHLSASQERSHEGERERGLVSPVQLQAGREEAQRIEQGKEQEQTPGPYERWREGEPYRQDRARVVRSLPLSSARRLVLTGGVAVGMLVLLFLLLWGSLIPKVPPFPPEPQPPPPHQPKAIVVMQFKALNADPQLEWMREAIRNNFNSQLSSVSNLKVYSEEYIDFLVQRDHLPEIEVASQLGIAKMLSGNFLAIANKLHIEAHIVDVQSGLLEGSDYVEGTQSDFFNLHRQLALKIMTHLNIAVSLGEKGGVPSVPPAPSLDTYKQLLEAEGETQAAGPPKEEDSHSQGSSQREEDKHSRTPLWWGWPRASVAWADEAPQQGLASEEEIRQVLERYRQAYEKKDLTLLENVYDTLPTTQREANAKYFQNTSGLRVTIRDVDIAVRGDEAAVSYIREDQFIDAETGRKVKLDVRITKIFVRTDGTWKIAVGKK